MKEQQIVHHYLGIGGMGDACLILAVCWDDPHALVTFFARGSDTNALISAFFRSFGVKYNIQPSRDVDQNRKELWRSFTSKPGFVSAAHLPDDLDYSWPNPEMCHARMVTSVPQWRDRLGRLHRKIMVVQPCGSSRSSSRQRYLSRDEYRALVDRYLKEGYEVYGLGGKRDRQEYDYRRPGHFFMSHIDIYDCLGMTRRHTIDDMLRVINSAEVCVSTDSWLKTYAMIAGVPTTVILTRYDGRYRPLGSDPTDCIFLDTRLWPNLRHLTIEQLLTSTTFQT